MMISQDGLLIRHCRKQDTGPKRPFPDTVGYSDVGQLGKHKYPIKLKLALLHTTYQLDFHVADYGLKHVTHGHEFGHNPAYSNTTRGYPKLEISLQN